ncbi:nucleolar protein dao-5 isoform X1 [Paralichthys olivaceus]|uniref:nucleolar protein dao-5 isoform X1 n=2 Tax=Paralichthys olivaceus TaxID=8255 RepID=UPI00375283B3
MANKYPSLRRPKRKLCYLTNKDSGSTKWTGSITLGDVDRMFDDLDSSSHDDGPLSSPPLLQTTDPRTQHSDGAASPVPHQSKKLPPREKGPEGTVLPAMRSTSPQRDIDSDIFKLHEPVKTSSPIEEIINVVDVEEDNDGKQVVSPILFDCEEERREEAKIQPPTVQEPQVKGHETEIIDDSDLEMPPSKFAFKRPTLSTHKNKVDASCKDGQPVTEKTQEKSHTAVFERKRNTQRQGNTDKSVAAVTQEPELATSDKKSTSVHSQSLGEMSTRVGKDMSVFLQKLRDAGQSKPACSRKSLTPVKVPAPPPEPEEDFLILDDDAPLWFTIPSKTATSKRQKQSRSDSSDKDSSKDKAAKDSPQETGQKEVESEQAELGIHPLDLSTNRKKRSQKKNKVTEPGNDKDELTTPEDLPAGDLVEQEKPNKKKRQQQLKKIPSKESDKADEEPKDTASRETDKEKQKTENKKRSKSSKDGKETAKTNTAKLLKRNRKVMQSSEEVQETAIDEAVKEQSEDHNNKNPGDVEDLSSLSDKQIMNSDSQTAKDSTDGEAKHNKRPVVTESSSSEESQSLGKRKRKPIGQWWMSCPQSTEETKVTYLTHKRSKQHSKEPSAAEASPGKTKKDKVLKKRNQKRPVTSFRQSTAKGKEKKTRQNKNRAAGGEAPNKMRATDEVLNTTDTEQIEEQQEEKEDVLDQDLDCGRSSPMVFQERDLSQNSVSVSPRGPQEHLRAADPEKRRRKPPSNWWTTNSMSEEMESGSSHPQQLKPKESKPPNERKKLSKQKPSRSPGLRTPKKGKVVVTSKTPGGADVPLMKPKPMFAPKTVKHSLATFKDIFTSVSETPTVVRSRDTGYNDRCGITAQPADVSVTERVTVSQTDKDTHSVDAVEFSSAQNSPPTNNSPQDSRCQPENTLKDLRSGPSSMIELQDYENCDDLSLQPSSIPGALSVSDLCAPPLKPLILQQKDKADLTEWFKTLWSSTVDDDGEITPDHFDWYFYKGRVCGFQVDLNSGSICNGKILLGSYMKKPLWVDHSATTVFNILTSTVAVIIDGKKSQLNPGQAFMVQSGHAYSIHNVTAQPAVLYFTRILAESSE